MSTVIRKILGWILIFYISLHALMYFNQRSLQYIPTQSLEIDPQTINLGYESVKITPSLQSLYSSNESSLPTVLFLHGNAGNAEHRVHKAQQFLDNKYNVLLVEYPQYGINRGRATEQSLTHAALKNIEWLQKKHPATPIIVYAESLGTGVAINMLNKNKKQVTAVILETPFDSMVKVGDRIYPLILAKKWLVKDQFDSLAKIKGINDVPTLYILAGKDEVVSFEAGLALFEAANQPKLKLTFSEAMHNNIYAYNPQAQIKDFLESQNIK